MATERGVVLVVDYQSSVRELAGRVVKRRGYTVLEAVSGPAVQ